MILLSLSTLYNYVHFSLEVQKATLDSSIYLLHQVIPRHVIKDWSLIKELFTLFLRCIELFQDLKHDFIMQSVHEVHSMLKEKMEIIYKSPFEVNRSFLSITEIEV